MAVPDQNLSEVTLTRSPSSSLFFTYTYAGTKEDYLHELLQRTYGPKNIPLWTLNEKPGDRVSTSKEDKTAIIQESLQSIRRKIGERNFKRTSKSFQYRCGQFIDTSLIDLNSTYIFLELNKKLYNRLKRFFVQPDKNTKRPPEKSTLSIKRIFLLLANDGQAIIIAEIQHKTQALKELIDDIHPFRGEFDTCVLSLKTSIPPDRYDPKKEPSLANWGYLTPFLGHTPKPHEEEIMCPLLHFFGWLIFKDWDAPSDPSNFDPKMFDKYHRLKIQHTIYRMHDLEISQTDWENHLDAIAFYIGRGTKLEREIFRRYDQEYQLTKSYLRNWDHRWTISRDSVVSIKQHSSSKNYDFTTESFWKVYQILSLQVLIEYLGCMQFNYQIAKIAYQDKDKDKLTHLIKHMHQFRLGINLVDFSRRATHAEYYAVLRDVFNIDKLIDELSNEVKDVLEIISMIQEEENEQRRENDQIAREKEREEERKRRDDEINRRQKEKDEKEQQDKQNAAEFNRRQKEKAEEAARIAEAEDARQRKQDTILSIIGAATIPFAILSGLMGMNTDTSREGCPADVPSFFEALITLDRRLLDSLITPEGAVPCMTFNDVVLLCVGFGVVIYGIAYKFLISKDPTSS